jgi:hypothetical protein
MKYTCLWLLILLSFGAFSQKKSIRFETGSFEEIKAKAKKENKLIFIYFNGNLPSDTYLEQMFFSKEEVKNYYDSHYINYKVTVTQNENGKLNDAAKLAKKYGVDGFPTVLYMNADEHVIDRIQGAPGTDAEQKSFMNDVQTPEKTFGYYNDNYKANNSDPKFLSRYLAVLERKDLPSDTVVQAYFRTQKDGQLMAKENWNVIKKYCKDYDSREFNFLVKRYPVYTSIYTKEAVDSTIHKIFSSAFKDFGTPGKREFTQQDYDYIKKKTEPLDAEIANRELFKLNVVFYQQEKKQQELFDLLAKDGDKYYKDLDYNSLARNVAERCENKVCLAKVSKWLSDEAAEEINNPNSFLFPIMAYDIYLCNSKILFKLGRKKDAKETVEKAIQSAQKNGLEKKSYKDAIELQDKINNMPEQ